MELSHEVKGRRTAPHVHHELVAVDQTVLNLGWQTCQDFDAANISARSCPHLTGCCYTHMKQPAFTGMALERDPCELLCSLIQSAENRETDSKVFKNQSNLVPIWGMDYDMPHICRICHRLDF